MSEEIKNENGSCDISDLVCDENNTDNLFLTGEDGKEYEFEQIAVIPLDEKVYCILRPVTPMEGVESEDEAFIMELVSDPENGGDTLELIDDETIVERVFEDYYRLCKEAEEEEQKGEN